MIELPKDWLYDQFDGYLKRGAIIRFHADGLGDPDHPGGKMKFAVVLNVSCPAPEIHYVFTTSKTAFYNKHTQFNHSIIKVQPGSYDCFPLETIIPFRTVHKIEIAKLKAQFVDGKLTFAGALNVTDVEAMNGIIKNGFFINPRTQKIILP